MPRYNEPPFLKEVRVHASKGRLEQAASSLETVIVKCLTEYTEAKNSEHPHPDFRIREEILYRVLIMRHLLNRMYADPRNDEFQSEGYRELQYQINTARRALGHKPPRFRTRNHGNTE
jgi:hypothetical protein